MKIRRLIAFALFSLIIALLGIVTGLSYQRAMHLVYPGRSALIHSPESMGLPVWELVPLKTSSDYTLASWYIPPPPGSDAVVIFVHGLAGNRSHLLPQAALLYKHGYGALMLDLRNHGESGGRITTYGYYERDDVAAAVYYALDRPEVGRVALVGESMGGAAVLLAAPDLPVTAIIVQSTLSSLEDNIANGIRQLTGLPAFPLAPLIIGFAEREAGTPISEVRPINEIARLSPRPVLILHGARDMLLPIDNARRLFEAAAEPKYLVVFARARHGGLLQADPTLFEDTMIGFLNQYMPVNLAVAG